MCIFAEPPQNRCFSHLASKSRIGDGALFVGRLGLSAESASRVFQVTTKSFNPTNHLRTTEGGAFLLPSWSPPATLPLGDPMPDRRRPVKARAPRAPLRPV